MITIKNDNNYNNEQLIMIILKCDKILQKLTNTKRINNNKNKFKKKT